jgi:hypothetical protein
VEQQCLRLERVASFARRKKSWQAKLLVLQFFFQGRAEPKVPTAWFDLNRRPCCWRRGLRVQEVKQNPPRRGDLLYQGPRSPHLQFVPEGGKDFSRHQSVSYFAEEYHELCRYLWGLPGSCQAHSW